jgi:hypothetical protein
MAEGRLGWMGFGMEGMGKEILWDSYMVYV